MSREPIRSAISKGAAYCAKRRRHAPNSGVGPDMCQGCAEDAAKAAVRRAVLTDRALTRRILRSLSRWHDAQSLTQIGFIAAAHRDARDSALNCVEHLNDEWRAADRKARARKRGTK